MTSIDEKKLQEAMQKNRPYLVIIEAMVQKIKYGQINVSLRVHDGRVTDITSQSFQKIRFDLGPGGSVATSTDTQLDPNPFQFPEK